MTWKFESRRHSLASRGIKTAQKIPRIQLNSNGNKRLDFEPIFKQWFDKILEKDMEWFRRVRDKFNEIKDDHPPPATKYGSSPEIRQAYKNAQRFLYQFPMFMYDAVHSGLNGEKVAEKHFRKELENKKKNLIAKVKKKVGTIIEVEVKLNPKGGLDGLIKGEDGTVRIETIGAGGYNIQRYHFRTLIKEKKKKTPSSQLDRFKGFLGYKDGKVHKDGDIIVIYDNKKGQTGIDSSGKRWVVSNETKGTHVVTNSLEQAKNSMKTKDFE